MTLEEQKSEIAKMLGWEYFPESKRSVQWEDGTHREFEVSEVWILKPTQRYKDDPCHYGFDEYYDDEIEVERRDLFEDYAYNLPFNDSWHFLMNALDFIESLPNVDTIISMNKGETCCVIRYGELNIFKFPSYKPSKKEAIFEAVSKFAKHYNEQNSNSHVTLQF